MTSERKGVATWDATGVSQDLAASGASWYYDWGATPSGIAAPAGTSFVPMIWGAADVTAATLDQVKSEGDVLLGFNEPDQSGQANMTVAQALNLWPQLMATGMTLGSPAVSFDAATPGGWLDQFMAGAKARGYRVNFITVHWYGGDFSTGAAVQQLESYLQAIYNQYHLPIWLTEFALTNYAGSTPTFPTEAQQAAFLTAATTMLDGLPYVQRYAWFALPVSAGGGTTGLFNRGSVRDRGRPRLRGGPLTRPVARVMLGNAALALDLPPEYRPAVKMRTCSDRVPTTATSSRWARTSPGARGRSDAGAASCWRRSAPARCSPRAVPSPRFGWAPAGPPTPPWPG